MEPGGYQMSMPDDQMHQMPPAQQMPPVPQMGQTNFAPGTPPAQGAPQHFRVSLTKVTSMVILTQQRRAVHTGTLEQLEKAARAAMIHNLTLGWWGIPFGLVWTPIALARNAGNMKKIREIGRAH